MSAASDVLHDAVHLLRAMGYANGKHQERYQNRKRVQREAEQRHQSQLPDDCDHRAQDDQRRAAHAPSEVEDNRRGYQCGGAEIQHDLHQSIDQVADQFGEADHANLDRALALLVGHPYGAVELVLVTQLLFNGSGELVIVDGLASDRVFLQQRHEHHARLEVVADQVADNTRAGNVLAQLLHTLH
ncbi:hypothetical protein D3C76_1081650 [compost metagenome]